MRTIFIFFWSFCLRTCSLILRRRFPLFRFPSVVVSSFFSRFYFLSFFVQDFYVSFLLSYSRLQSFFFSFVAVICTCCICMSFFIFFVVCPIGVVLPSYNRFPFSCRFHDYPFFSFTCMSDFYCNCRFSSCSLFCCLFQYYGRFLLIVVVWLFAVCMSFLRFVVVFTFNAVFFTFIVVLYFYFETYNYNSTFPCNNIYHQIYFPKSNLVKKFCCCFFLINFKKALLGMKPTGTVFPGDPDILPGQTLHYGRYLVLSLGTGTSKIEKKYNAKMAANWGILGWLYKDGNCPLIDAFIYAGCDMVDLHMALIFRSIRCEQNYLRLQVITNQL